MSSASRPTLMLASASPFRRRLLEAAGVAVEVVPAAVDEALLKRELDGAAPDEIALALARAKAEAVSARFPAALTIGADQVLALGDQLLSKPRDMAEARDQLRQLRGRLHQLHSGVALAEAGAAVWSHAETATLVMRPFSDAFLERYLAEAGEAVCRTVGGYEIEGRGIQLFEQVSGDCFTIIGLPLLALLAELRARGALDT